MDVGAARFGEVHGAELAYSNARDRDPAADWVASAALVEVHSHGRVVVRGNVAGRYVDVGDQDDPMGPGTGAGGAAGAILGFAFGPAAFAEGLLTGAAVGGIVEASRVPELDGPAFDAIREQLPGGTSAIVVCSSRAQIKSMFDAVLPMADTLVHYRLDPPAEAELRAALAEAPAAS